MMRVPTEITDHIFGFLHSDHDFESLETCSQLFPQSVDRYLYSQVALPLFGFAPPVPKCPFNDKPTYVIDPAIFSIRMTQSPNIAAHVRVLRIIITVRVGYGQAALPLFPHILSSLSQVNSIQLKATESFRWHDLGPDFCTAFQNRIQSPFIQAVAISSIYGFPLRTFDHCENLNELQIDARVGSPDDIKPRSTSPYPRLLSLRVVGGPNSQPDFITSWITKTKPIHTLSLHTYISESLPKFRSLIGLCSTTLVNLELAFFHLDPTEFVFSAIHLPLLEHITVRSHLTVTLPTEYYSSIPLFPKFLRSIIRSSPIRLTLHLRFQFVLISYISLALDWSEVIAIFAPSNEFRLVEVYFTKVDSQSQSGARLVQAVSSFEQNSVVKELVEVGKLVVIKMDE